jgi:hypothetical protein
LRTSLRMNWTGRLGLGSGRRNERTVDLAGAEGAGGAWKFWPYFKRFFFLLPFLHGLRFLFWICWNGSVLAWRQRYNTIQTTHTFISTSHDA